VGLLGVGVLVATQLSVGCGDSAGSKDDESEDTEGLEMCCELGALCHVAGRQDNPMGECHEIGHENDPARCRSNYDRCLAICAPSGEGGQGGEPVRHACE
jgi:hypothetical protein